MNDNVKQVNLGKKSFSGFLWVFGSLFFNQLTNIGSMAVLARKLTPYEFGVIGAAMLFVEFTNILNSLGVAPTLVRKATVTREDEYTAYTSSIFIGIILYIITFIISSPAASFFKIPELGPVLKILGIIYIISSFNTVSQVLLSRNLRFKEIAYNTMFSQFFGWGVFSITMALMGFGYWSLVGGRIANVTFSTIGLLIRQPHCRKISIDKKSLKNIYGFGSKLSINAIILYFAQQTDTIIVGRIMGATSLGIYNRAYSLMALLANFLGNSLNRILLPSSTKIKGDKSRMASAFDKLITISSITLFPLTFFIIIFSSEIINILFGNQWHKTISLFAILALGTFFRFGYRIGSSMAITLGKLKGVMIRQVIYLLLVVSSVLIGIRYGLNGVAFAVLISLMINYLLCSFQVIFLFNSSYTSFFQAHWSGIKISLVVILINCPLSYLLREKNHFNDFFIILIPLIITFIFLTAIYFYFPVLIGQKQIIMLQTLFKKNKESHVLK